MKIEHACSLCGKPEKREYITPEGTDYICSTCVQHSLQASEGQHATRFDLDPLSLKRGYIRALFLEDERWINCIEKYWMIVPGDPKNQKHVNIDLKLKEQLSDQVHPDTYEDRRAYFKAWLGAECCADDCGEYCDECSSYLKHGIKFKSVSYRLSKDFDPDVRRFMEKYQRFWLKSEEEKALKEMKGGAFYGNGRKVSNETNSNDLIRFGQREGIGQPGGGQEDSGNPYQDQQKGFLRPGFGDLAFKSQV